MARKYLRSVHLYSCGVLFAMMLAVLIGCQKKVNQSASDNVPVIPVSKTVEREVTDYAEYTGRTDAVLAVNVRARATGFLVSTRFDEGADVKEGDLLFEIDPVPYELSVKQAEATVKSAEASLVTAKATVEADKKGVRISGIGGAISTLQLLTDEQAVVSAEAKLESAKVSLETAQVNLGYTKVKAEISGQVSRYYYTPGNLISQDQTLLTTIVSTEYIYAYFDIEQRVRDKLVQTMSSDKGITQLMSVNQQAMRAVVGGMGWLSPMQRANLPVTMTIEGQKDVVYRGVLDFLNNQVNPSTGTVAARGFFRNSRQPGGLVSLIPGMFVRIQIPLGGKHKSQLVIDRAIGSDQGLKYVYVMDAEKKVQYRRIVPGALQEDGLRVIDPFKAKTASELESGVKPDEWVVVGGLQQLKPRSVIDPEEIPMPTLASDLAKLKNPGGGSGKEGGGKGGGKEGGKGKGEQSPSGGKK
jgi:RND family efflux transporter MFP subunit